MGEHRNPNLKNKAVFTQRDMILGIPARVFIGTLFLVAFAAVVFCVYLPIYLGLGSSLVMGLLVLIPVYLVHKEDPEAYIVWLRSLFAAARLTVSRSTRRRVLLLSRRADGSLQVTTITKRSSKC
ncbi:hypothetical protein [Pseudomonas sp. RIT-PI-AD]|uniref:hypothetical protein n=1 Tax=Pseudomonas sp. RIT-PI-AD TaxID=3035294 RepID=UPI0021DAA390|nr:hypothetical protein [Pseudomonas sp. RIT-PI-AD]